VKKENLKYRNIYYYSRKEVIIMTDATKQALVASGKIILTVALQAAIAQTFIEVQKYLNNNNQQPVAKG
jgi:hypothetical protein